MTTAAPARALLSLDRVSKSFGATRALKDVSLEVLPGEVHVLAGENGAGKSTLIKILAGVHTQFEGELRVGGQPVRFTSPADARRSGIATIHQELSLVPALSIADNFLLSAEGRALSIPSRRALGDATRASLAAVGLSVDPELAVETLALGDRQLVEIARALSQAARVLVMDEPTSALSEPEVERLFERIELLRARGVAILYISHRMDEIYRIGDRITVLRDGERCLTERRKDLSPDALVLAMVGKALAKSRPARPALADADAILEVRGLGAAPPAALRELSFSLRRGEILGLAGLQGSGASEALFLLFDGRGARGEVLLRGRPYVAKTPREAIGRGVVLLPSDRGLSVFSELSVLRNATLSSLSRFSPRFVVEGALELTALAEHAPKLALKAPSFQAPASELSGGNQQKLALLRCLLTEPNVLLLDDPTRGVDVGARAEIYGLLEALAGRGVGVVLQSTDLDELCQICDRVIVLFQGRAISSLDRSELTRERLVPPIMGVLS